MPADYKYQFIFLGRLKHCVQALMNWESFTADRLKLMSSPLKSLTSSTLPTCSLVDVLAIRWMSQAPNC